jgi:glutaryl-CoA dehydrogenase (non-decarboxylating)
VSRILTPDQIELRAKVRAFAREIVEPRRLEAFENPPFLMELNRLMGQAGIFRTVAPKSVGGAEMGTMGGVLVVEELARECPAVAIGAMMQMLFPLNMLMNPAVTERWFDRAVNGEINVAVASTDPVGLANYAEQPEIAKRDGDDYVLNGVRYFSTQGIFADMVGVAGLFENDMHMFWIDTKQSGVKVTPMPKMGMGAPWGCFELTDVRVPSEFVNDLSFLVKDRVLINVAGAGKVSTHYITALSLGIAEGVWEKTEAFLRKRTVRNQPLASMQALQHKLVRMRQNIEAGRSMLYDAAQLVDAGQGDNVLDHLMKPFVSEMAVDVAQECVTLHGGRGYQRSEGIEIYLRDAIGCLIGESTTDMHYSTVAYLLDLPGAEPGAP